MVFFWVSAPLRDAIPKLARLAFCRQKLVFALPVAETGYNRGKTAETGYNREKPAETKKSL